MKFQEVNFFHKLDLSQYQMHFQEKHITSTCASLPNRLVSVLSTNNFKRASWMTQSITEVLKKLLTIAAGYLTCLAFRHTLVLTRTAGKTTCKGYLQAVCQTRKLPVLARLFPQLDPLKITNPLRMCSKGYSAWFLCVRMSVCYHPSGNSFQLLIQTKVSQGHL